MSDLLWPGLHRAAGLFDDDAVLASLLRVESVWAHVLEESGLVPTGTSAILDRVAEAVDPDAVAVAAEGGGNPLIPWLAEIRARARAIDPAAAAAIHLGLTSQDVVDTAVLLCAKDCLVAIADELDLQIAVLAALAAEHRATPMVARTLGQHALPTTFGVRVASWLRGLLVARTRVRDVVTSLPVQLGGAAGTLAALVEVCRAAGTADPVAVTAEPVTAARELVASTARGLGLLPTPPWDTVREPVTRVGDVLVTVSDALGHLANDVVLQSRPEVAELSEPAADGRGVSSAMPQKRNPVLAILIRRQAMSAPLLGAQLHLAAAAAVDERPDGAWHTEWAPLRDLCRRTVGAARQATELVTGLEVHPDAMRAHLDRALPGALAERLVSVLAPLVPGGRAEVTRLVSVAADADEFASLVGPLVVGRLTHGELAALLDPTAYLGVAVSLVDEVVAEATSAPPLPHPSLPHPSTPS